MPKAKQKIKSHSGTIKDWPEDDRPREKLLKRGEEALSNTELLAIVLRTGNASTGQSALDHARLLMNTFGNFRALSNAGISEVCEIKGIGPAKAATIKAVMEIAKRYYADQIPKSKPLSKSEDVFAHFYPQLKDKKKESFFVLLLDGKNRHYKTVRISEGSLTSSLVHPREVFNPIIKESAASIILIHNHPSGDPAPSHEDREITSRLKEIGHLMGIKVLDHIIIGDEIYFSFMDSGIL